MKLKNCIICNKEIGGQKRMYCGGACKQKHHYDRIKTQSNTYHSQTIRGYKRKLEYIELLGGKCIKCGYKKNVAALHFHHKNPSEKEFGLDIRAFSNNKMEKLLKEVLKCELLCSNCHLEKHNPEYTFQQLLKIINSKKDKSKFQS